MVAVSCGGMIDVELLQEAIEIARPARRDRGRTECVLEAKIPADDPRHQFAQRCITVGVGRPRNGNDRGELRIAQPRKCAGKSRQHKAQSDRRTRAQRRSLPGEREDARANDCSNAERDQVQRAKRALERMFALLSRFFVTASTSV